MNTQTDPGADFGLKHALLYILACSASPISKDQLAEICVSSGAGTPFDVYNAITELEKVNNIIEDSGLLKASEAAAASSITLRSDLPYAVRQRIESDTRGIAMANKNAKSVITSRETPRSGGVICEMSVKEGNKEIFSMRILTDTDEEGERTEKLLRGRAAELYDAVLSVLYTP